jgi:hypothetical protein
MANLYKLSTSLALSPHNEPCATLTSASHPVIPFSPKSVLRTAVSISLWPAIYMFIQASLFDVLASLKSLVARRPV